MAALYEITGAWACVYAMADDPDIDEQTWFDTLEAIEGEVEDKADAYAKIIKELDAEVGKYKAEVERLQARKTTIENNIKRLKDNLKKTMEITGKTKFKTDLFSFGIQLNGGKAPLVANYLDVMDIPEEYRKIEYKPDIEKIRAALEDGEQLDFAYIGDRGTSLRIR